MNNFIRLENGRRCNEIKKVRLGYECSDGTNTNVGPTVNADGRLSSHYM